MQVFITDLDSVNGTMIGKTKCRPNRARLLRLGDTVRPTHDRQNSQHAHSYVDVDPPATHGPSLHTFWRDANPRSTGRIRHPRVPAGGSQGAAEHCRTRLQDPESSATHTSSTQRASL